MFILEEFEFHDDKKKIKIKIGVTNNIEKRVKTHQTGNPNEIRVFHYEERDDAYKVESKLKKHFKK